MSATNPYGEAEVIVLPYTVVTATAQGFDIQDRANIEALLGVDVRGVGLAVMIGRGAGREAGTLPLGGLMEAVLRERERKAAEGGAGAAEYFHLAGAYDVVRRDWGRARGAYERALAHDPDNVVCLHNLAILLESRYGENAEARRRYERCLALRPYHAKTRAPLFWSGWGSMMRRGRDTSRRLRWIR